MDYFQGVVADYLRADRSTFVNSEFLLQLDKGNSPGKGRHWYCDIVAVNFRDSTIYLCEVSFSKTLHALIRRLTIWSENWPALCAGVSRDSLVPSEWTVRPWLFIPMDRCGVLAEKLPTVIGIGTESYHMPDPKVTALEDVLPWKYHNHVRDCDNTLEIKKG